MTGRPLRRTAARDAAVLAVLALAVAVPYAFMSPGYLREDFDSLRNVALDGALAAAGSDVAVARPGAVPVFALVFGLLGGEPAVAVALMAVVAAVNAILLYLVLLRALPRSLSLAATAVWVLLPTRSALSHWISTAHLGVALALLLGAVLLLWREEPTPTVVAAAVAALVVSGLTYEATIPAGLAAAIVVPWVAAGTRQWRVILPCAAALLGVVAWNGLTTTREPIGLVSATSVFHGHFGSELIKLPVAGTLAAAVVVAALGWSGARVVVRGPRAGIGERLVLVGVAIVAVGTAPFLLHGGEIDYVMQGDRATLVSGVGSAVLLAGVGVLLSRWRPLIVVSTAGLVGGMAVTQGLNHVGYARSSQQVRDTVRAAEARVRAGDDSVVVAAHLPVGCGGVEGLNSDWYLREAVEWSLGRPARDVQLLDVDRTPSALDGPQVVDMTGLPSQCGIVGWHRFDRLAFAPSVPAERTSRAQRLRTAWS